MKQQTSLHFYFLYKVSTIRFPRDVQTPHIPRRKPALYYYCNEYFTRLIIFQSFKSSCKPCQFFFTYYTNLSKTRRLKLISSSQ